MKRPELLSLAFKTWGHLGTRPPHFSLWVTRIPLKLTFTMLPSYFSVASSWPLSHPTYCQYSWLQVLGFFHEQTNSWKQPANATLGDLPLRAIPRLWAYWQIDKSVSKGYAPLKKVNQSQNCQVKSLLIGTEAHVGSWKHSRVPISLCRTYSGNWPHCPGAGCCPQVKCLGLLS